MKNIHGGNVYKYARETGIEAEKITDFSANINPFGMSENGIIALKNNILKLIHYPDPDNELLKKALSDVYHIDEKHIVLGNGAAEIIYAVCRLPNIRHVIITAPAFSEYEKAAQSAKLPVKTIYTQKSENFRVTFSLIQAHKNLLKDSILFLGNPNNPDGSLLEHEDGFKIIELAAKNNCLVVIDESFIDFTDGHTSYRSYIGKFDNLLVLHSLTKFYAVPGLRIGATYGSMNHVQSLESLLPEWRVNHLAAVYSKEAIFDKEYITRTKTFISQEKDRVYQLYKDLHFLEPYFPSVNFMLISWHHNKKTVAQLETFLRSRYIFIRSCKAYDGLGENWFRIAIKNKEANDQLFTLIKRFGENE